MKSILFYAMKGEKMCFLHVLMNALDLHQKGATVKIILEGESVKLPSELTKENNPLYKKALEADLIAGVCEACSKMLGVYEQNLELELTFLGDMMGHAPMAPFVEKGFEIISM